MLSTRRLFTFTGLRFRIAACLLSCLLTGACDPSATFAPEPRMNRIEGWIPYWTDEAAVAREAVAAGFTDLLFFHGTVTEQGAVRLENPQGLAQGRSMAERGGVRTWLTVTNHGKSLDGALGAGRLTAHADRLVRVFRESRCHHLDLDYEYLTPAQAARLPELAALLDARLPASTRLSFTLQPVDGIHRPGQIPMVKQLLRMPRIHTIRFMMYDYAWRNSLPGGLCPLPNYQQLLDTWSGYGGKLTVCLPLYGYDWPRPNDTSLPRAETVFMRNVPHMNAHFAWMRHEGELAARHVHDGMLHMAAIPSLRAINLRSRRALDAGISAVAFWHLGAAELAPVVRATHRRARMDEGVHYVEIEGWNEWLEPFKRRVCRVVTGDGTSLEAMARQYNIPVASMRQFNRHLRGDTDGKTIYLPLAR